MNPVWRLPERNCTQMLKNYSAAKRFKYTLLQNTKWPTTQIYNLKAKLNNKNNLVRWYVCQGQQLPLTTSCLWTHGEIWIVRKWSQPTFDRYVGQYRRYGDTSIHINIYSTSTQRKLCCHGEHYVGHSISCDRLQAKHIPNTYESKCLCEQIRLMYVLNRDM